jgi:hypothetical protein
MISSREYKNDRNTVNEHVFLKEFYMDISYTLCPCIKMKHVILTRLYSYNMNIIRTVVHSTNVLPNILYNR